MRRLWPTLLAAATLLLAACSWNPLPGLITTRTAKEREITALRVEHGKAMEALRAEEQAKVQQVVAGKDAQMVAAAGSLYGQQQVFASIHQPTRTDLLFRNLSVEAWTALGNVAPTVDAMRAMNERLARELDETRTSLADLQQSHAAAVAQNQALADATKRFQEELAELAKRKADAERDFAAKLDEKQQKLTTVQNQLIAAGDQQKADAEARRAQLAKLSWGSGILAALCLAGAIWSPVSKRELALAAAVFAGAAVAIPFVEGWHVLAAVGLALAGLVSWALIKHSRKERAHDALALTTQDLREKGGEIAKAVEETLADRTARYRRAPDGTLVTERDPAIEREIETALAEYDVLPAKPAA